MINKLKVSPLRRYSTKNLDITRKVRVDVIHKSNAIRVSVPCIFRNFHFQRYHCSQGVNLNIIKITTAALDAIPNNISTSHNIKQNPIISKSYLLPYRFGYFWPTKFCSGCRNYSHEYHRP